MKLHQAITLPLLLAALALLSGCSLALDFTECATDADCAALGDGLTCVNNECVGGGGEDVVEEAVSTACTLNSECHERFDTNYACMDSVCTDLRSEDCQTVFWPDQGVDNVIFIGSLLPLTGPLAPFGGIPIEQSLTLGIEDINNNGLPGSRKAVLVSCNSRALPEVGLRAARHLVDDIGTPAIVGPLISNGFIDVVNQVTKEAGVFTISPSASAPGIASLNDDNLAWRIIASDVYQGSAIIDRVKELGVSTVGVYVKDDAYGNGLFGVIGQQLTELLGQDNVRFINYQDPTGLDEAAARDALSNATTSMLNWNKYPEMIIILGTGEVVDIVYQHFQSLKASDGNTPDPKPFILTSHGGVPVLPSLFERSDPPTYFANFDEVAAIIEGTSSNIVGDGFIPFQIRFNARYPGEQFVTASVFGMDAIMVIGLALCALNPDNPVTGTDIAANISQIVDKEGSTATWSPGFFTAACNNLSSGNGVDYNGVTGPLDFNLETGEIRSNVLGWDVIFDGDVFTIDAARLYILDEAPATTGTWFCGSTLCAPGAACINGACQCGDTTCSMAEGDSCDPGASLCTCGGAQCVEGASCSDGSCACGTATCTTENGDACDASTDSCTCGIEAACSGTSGDQCASGSSPIACD